MYYAWPTAVDFSQGARPVVRGHEEDDVLRKMQGRYKKFFTALQVDGTWVDLTVHGQGLPEGGRPVSEGRVSRYVRGRQRALQEKYLNEVDENTPLLYSDAVSPEKITSPEVIPTPDPEPEAVAPNVPTPQEEEARETVLLSVDPVVAKGIVEFLALDKEQREAAINALSALSVSAEVFLQATNVALQDNTDLMVNIGGEDQPA